MARDPWNSIEPTKPKDPWERLPPMRIDVPRDPYPDRPDDDNPFDPTTVPSPAPDRDGGA